jgi:hypothetical protein
MTDFIAVTVATVAIAVVFGICLLPLYLYSRETDS